MTPDSFYEILCCFFQINAIKSYDKRKTFFCPNTVTQKGEVGQETAGMRVQILLR